MHPARSGPGGKRYFYVGGGRFRVLFFLARARGFCAPGSVVALITPISPLCDVVRCVQAQCILEIAVVRVVSHSSDTANTIPGRPRGATPLLCRRPSDAAAKPGVALPCAGWRASSMSSMSSIAHEAVEAVEQSRLCALPRETQITCPGGQSARSLTETDGQQANRRHRVNQMRSPDRRQDRGAQARAATLIAR